MSATTGSSQTCELTVLRAGKAAERIELAPETTIGQVTEMCRQLGLRLAAVEPARAESAGAEGPRGRVLSDEERALYDRLESQVGIEELRRRSRSDGPWLTTEQVLAHLRSLAEE